MKKLLFLSLLLFSFRVFSQVAPCPPCTPLKVQKEITKVLCQGRIFVGGTWTTYAPVLWVNIKYTESKCDGVTTIVIDQVLVTSNLINYEEQGIIYDLLCDPPGRALHPMSLGDINGWHMWTLDLVNELLPPATSGNRVIRFPAGCYAMGRVTWPAGAVAYVQGDLGVDTLQLTESIVRLTCGTNCCEVEIDNNTGTPIYQTIKPSGICSNQPDVTGADQITITNPVTGQNTTYNGTLIITSPCTQSCRDDYNVNVITSDGQKESTNLDLQFSAAPTNVSDYIKFKTVSSINTVRVYDMRGVLIIDRKPENQTLNLSELQSGIYFLQVYLANNQVRTIKFVKN